jgi:hypothetical protein
LTQSRDGISIHRMRHVLKAVTLCLVLAAPASAYYGARFEPPDGFIYHGCGWDGYSSQAYYNEMLPADHHPLILQVVASMPGTRWCDVGHIVQSLTQNIVHPDGQYIEYGLHFQGRDTWMLESVFALTSTMDHYIDTLAIAPQQFGKPGTLPIFLSDVKARRGIVHRAFVHRCSFPEGPEGSDGKR